MKQFNKHLALKRNIILFIFAIFIGFFTIYSCSSPQKNLPEKSLIKQRISATINLGWGWLHAEKSKIKEMKKSKDKLLVKVEYTLVIDRNEGEITPEELDRFYDFLPMCKDLLIRRTMRCNVTEELLFTNTLEYGWMPQLAVDARPEMLPLIAAWKEKRR